MPYIGLIHGPLALVCMVVAFALIIVVIRAPHSDLVDIVRALMRLEPRDSKRGGR